jgi:hypothetical protein
MKRTRRLLVPSILACVLAAALVLAATASAEIRVGEATAPVDPAIPAEADIIGARAEYDSDAGAVTFKVTTAALPSPGTEAEPNGMEMDVGLASTSVCAPSVIGGGNLYPTFAINYSYVQPGFVTWWLLESAGSEPKVENGTAGLATRSASVTTTTLEGSGPKAADQPFTCAAAQVRNGFEILGQPLVFPIAVPPPPAPANPTPTPSQALAAAAPHAAPAALAIVRSKPLKLRAGKWRTVKIKVANTGGAATAAGSLRLKAPRGVLVKPEKQRLPVLSAGGTWTVSAKVRLTRKAKKKSTVSLTAAAGGITATGALVLKRKG